MTPRAPSPVGRPNRGDAYRGLHVLVDDDPRWGRDPVEQARAACRARVPVVQLRAKYAGDATTLAWAREIRAMTRAAGIRFVVNDRFDIALMAEADAVHLGQDDLPPSALPAAARAMLAVGRSTHTTEQLAATRDEDVDYVAYGPVFGTRSKDSPFSARGLEAVAEAVRTAAPRPLVAIGGIEMSDLAALRALGVAGVAVISAVAAAADPERAAGELIAAFGGANGRDAGDASDARDVGDRRDRSRA